MRGFLRRNATFSILAPLAVVILALFEFVYARSHGPALDVVLGLIGFAQMVLMLSSLCVGTITLIIARPHERKAVFGRALAGICINALLLTLLLIPLIVRAFTLRGDFPTTPQGRLDRAMRELATASTEEKRFCALDDAAKESFETGNIEDARKYAAELLALAPKFQRDWNYGNAIQDGNLVAGRIALKEGHIEEAKQFLLEAGKSPGSPQMDSFGPNMSLARDLLEKGEREVVLQYFESCRKFWSMGQGDLDQWTKDVKDGRIPNFGANLVY